ncbi:cell division protein FtsZ [Flexibacter flexilis DSM 6793]|uniref:Cell division protein FtsZ n=1 Tax=Flexibacter flexilis DSM 6793 TaxID=927664 RepID=A0A1I1M5S2_9BACT|nr:cell division protein FtsZ [Flexibacter flexilis]SFC80092.1 cell division protein FtsZ [Flexibacter flexilis DSM 6793]
MKEKVHSFELPDRHKSIIKVVGVGGGGSNAVNFMYGQGIKDVEFVVCNTDSQALEKSPVPTRLQIGKALTEGLGAGANPTKGRDAAVESEDDIRATIAIDNTKMVFITAGMGGGTGTGAAPVIARVAKEQGLLTVGIVTSPFAFEGPRKRKQAEVGISEMKEYCDTVLVILNDKIREMFGNMSIKEAYAQADMVLTTAARSIAEVITRHAEVNVDFEDVKTVMQNSGTAVLGSAEVSGEDRAIRAAQQALASPLLDNREIRGAQKILLSIISGDSPSMTMDEFAAISEYIQEQAGENADIIYGNSIDPSLGDKISVTVIATGFEDEHSKKVELAKVKDLDTGHIVLPVHRTPPPTPPSAMEEGNKVPTPLPVAPLAQELPVSEPVPLANTVLPPVVVEDNLPKNEPVAPKNEPVVRPETPREVLPLDDNINIQPASRNPYDQGLVQSERERELQRQLFELKAQQRRKEVLGNAGHGQEMPRAWDNEMKQSLDQPAYMRQERKLNNVPNSNQSNVSRYTLGENNDLSSNNKYLSDNVD